MHRTYKPASTDLLDRFRNVIFQMRKNNVYQDMAVNPEVFKDAYESLGRALPRAFPKLERLTIRVEPMRDFTSTNRTDYDAETYNLFDGRRVHFLDGLSGVGNVAHDVGCNGILPCDCQLLPFRHMRRLVVQVNTKNMFCFLKGGRRPYLEWFTDRPWANCLLVCPKGVAPLLSNATRHPNSDIDHRYYMEYRMGEPISYESRRSYMDPRNLGHNLDQYAVAREPGHEERFLAYLNRPDSPEP